MASVAAADRAGLEQQLAVLDTLRSSPDPTVSISSPATPPTSPASPNRKTSLAAGGFAGLIIGLLAILALNALDPKLRDEDQLREIYALPLLSKIPKQRAGKAPLVPRELIPAVGEAFRTLRAAFTVRHGGTDYDAPRRGSAILVTGDAAAAGKTTVALNLAMSLTAAGKQVIVIEADLRRPSIGQALRVRAPKGVAEVLLGKADLVEALVWIPQHGPQLELLLGTTADAGEIDRISPESARQLVREAREMCDFVVIDSPPMTEVTDALAFAEEADDVVLVARIGASQVRKMSDLGELLTRSRIVPAGIVLVGVAESGGYYYRGAGEQHVFAGLLQRRGREEQTVAAYPRGVEHRSVPEPRSVRVLRNGRRKDDQPEATNGKVGRAATVEQAATASWNELSAAAELGRAEKKASPPEQGRRGPKSTGAAPQQSRKSTRDQGSSPQRGGDDRRRGPASPEGGASDPEAGID
jgi:Mrp family chromosome partitioning ATPase